ncbi:MAG TPA: hypothetical protein PK668_22955 [Myxococcota bacterium]|nr:hypothetical protein [Myxococcota bacterium]HRY95555.1 hypothetical protein [Myxococcota bacterium]HSA22745.1 hypothetical protein [Myxococcota bacterium]
MLYGLLWLNLGLLLQAHAPASNPLPGPLPASFALHHVVGWGYSCGGHCAFRFSGQSDVSLSLDPDHTAVARDAGDSRRQSSFPDGVTFDDRAWDVAWQGTWSERAGALELRLEPGKVACEASTTKGDKQEAVPCKAPAALVLRCLVRKVIVDGPEGPAPRKPHTRFCGTVPCAEDEAAEREAIGRRTLVCSGDEQRAPASAFPWVFGLGERIDTVEIGEPDPNTRYVLTPAPVR